MSSAAMLAVALKCAKKSEPPLMLTIFALQDSYGTACNVIGDGALTTILTGYAKKHNIEKQEISIEL